MLRPVIDPRREFGKAVFTSSELCVLLAAHFRCDPANYTDDKEREELLEHINPEKIRIENSGGKIQVSVSSICTAYLPDNYRQFALKPHALNESEFYYAPTSLAKAIQAQLKRIREAEEGLYILLDR